MGHRKTQSGFTIVELLIVVVVIAILAAITIVAYNGIQNRAKASAAQTAAAQAVKKVALWKVDNADQSPDFATFTDLVGAASASQYQYTAGANGAFCLTATVNSLSYKADQSSVVAKGACDGHGVDGGGTITNWAMNPSFESNDASYARSGASAASANFSRSTVRSHAGAASLLQSVTGTGQTGLAMAVQATGDRLRINQGESANWSFWVYSTKAGNVVPYCDGSLVAGGYAGLSGAPNVNIPANTWTKVVGYGSRGAGSGDMYITQCGAYNLSVVSGDQLWFDEFIITKGAAQNAYADGNSPGWVWTGTPNNSISVGPAL